MFGRGERLREEEGLRIALLVGQHEADSNYGMRQSAAQDRDLQMLTRRRQNCSNLFISRACHSSDRSSPQQPDSLNMI